MMAGGCITNEKFVILDLISDGPAIKMLGQKKETENSRLLIKKQVHEFASGMQIDRLPLSKMTIGTISLTLIETPECNFYLRAQIVDNKNMSNGLITILLVDELKWNQNVEFSNLYECPKDIAKMFLSSETLLLADVSPLYYNKWSDNCMKALKTQLIHRTVSGTVYREAGKVALFRPYEPIEQGQLVAESMVECGMAYISPSFPGLRPFPVIDHAFLSNHFAKKSFLYSSNHLKTPVLRRPGTAAAYPLIPGPLQTLESPPPPIVMSRSTEDGGNEVGFETQKPSLLQIPLSPGFVEECEITHIENGPWKFYVKLRNQKNYWINLSLRIQKIVLAKSLQPVINIARGQLLLCRVNEEYFRGVCTNANIQYSKKVKVILIDIGSEEDVLVSNVWKLPEEVSDIPILAYRCCLKDLPKSYQTLTCANFTQLVSHRSMILTVDRFNSNLQTLDVDLKIKNISVLKLILNKVFDQECLGQKDEVTVVYVDDSKGLVYLQLIKNQDRIFQMQVSIQSVIRSAHNLTHLFTGLPCLAFYSADEEWYRALVLEENSGNVKILFVDYGNIEEVSSGTHIKEIPDILLEDMIAQAIPCLLTGLEEERLNSDKIFAWVKDKSLEAVPTETTNISLYGLPFSVHKIRLYDTATDACMNDEVTRKYVPPNSRKPSTHFFKDTPVAAPITTAAVSKDLTIPEITVIPDWLKVCRVTYFKSPSDFYVKLMENEKVLKVIEETLTSAFHTQEMVTLCTCNVGDYVMVASSKMGQAPRRAVVESVVQDAYEMRLLDVGKVETISRYQVRGLPAEASVERYLPQAVKCSLDVSCSPSVQKDTFESFVTKYPISVHFIRKENDAWKVALLRTSDLTKDLNGGSSSNGKYFPPRKYSSTEKSERSNWRERDQDKTDHGRKSSWRSQERDETTEGSRENPPQRRSSSSSNSSNSQYVWTRKNSGCDSSHRSESIDTVDKAPEKRVYRVARSPTKQRLGLKKERERGTSASTNEKEDAQCVVSEPQPFLSNETVFVTYYDEDSKVIWVQRQADSELLTQLNSVLENVSGFSAESVDPKAGEVCIGQSIVDDFWYRARVLSGGGTTYDVHYIDFGNTERIPLERVKRIPTSLLAMHQLGYPCRLANSRSVTGMESIMNLADEELTVKTLSKDADAFAVNLFYNNEPIEMYFKGSSSAEDGGEERASTSTKVSGSDKEKASTSAEGSGCCEEKAKSEGGVCEELRDELADDVFEPPSIEGAESDLSIGTERRTIDRVRPPVDGPVELYISYTCEDGSFWAQLASNSEVLDEVMYKLGSVVETSPSAERFEEGLFCCAKYAADDGWYRAQVVSIEGNEVQVSFIDYGNVETVSSSEVRVLPDDCWEVSAQAFFVRLSDGEGSAILGDEIKVLLYSLQDVIVDGVLSGDSVSGYILKEASANGKSLGESLVKCDANEENSPVESYNDDASKVKEEDLEVVMISSDEKTSVPNCSDDETKGSEIEDREENGSGFEKSCSEVADVVIEETLENLCSLEGKEVDSSVDEITKNISAIRLEESADENVDDSCVTKAEASSTADDEMLKTSYGSTMKSVGNLGELSEGSDLYVTVAESKPFFTSTLKGLASPKVSTEDSEIYYSFDVDGDVTEGDYEIAAESMKEVDLDSKVSSDVEKDVGPNIFRDVERDVSSIDACDGGSKILTDGERGWISSVSSDVGKDVDPNISPGVERDVDPTVSPDEERGENISDSSNMKTDKSDDNISSNVESEPNTFSDGERDVDSSISPDVDTDVESNISPNVKRDENFNLSSDGPNLSYNQESYCNISPYAERDVDSNNSFRTEDENLSDLLNVTDESLFAEMRSSSVLAEANDFEGFEDSTVVEDNSEEDQSPYSCCGNSLEKKVLVSEFTVTHVEDNGCVWVQDLSQSEMLERLMISIEYLMKSGTAVPLTDPEVERLCLAKYHADETWYRAKVTSVNKDEIQVLYVDFGNVSNVGFSDIYVIGKEHLILPSQAIKCKIDNVGTGSLETLSYLSALPSFHGKVKEEANEAILMDISVDCMPLDFERILGEQIDQQLSYSDGILRSETRRDFEKPVTESIVDVDRSEELEDEQKVFASRETNITDEQSGTRSNSSIIEEIDSSDVLCQTDVVLERCAGEEEGILEEVARLSSSVCKGEGVDPSEVVGDRIRKEEELSESLAEFDRNAELEEEQGSFTNRETSIDEQSETPTTSSTFENVDSLDALYQNDTGLERREQEVSTVGAVNLSVEPTCTPTRLLNQDENVKNEHEQSFQTVDKNLLDGRVEDEVLPHTDQNVFVIDELDQPGKPPGTHIDGMQINACGNREEEDHLDSEIIVPDVPTELPGTDLVLTGPEEHFSASGEEIVFSESLELQEEARITKQGFSTIGDQKPSIESVKETTETLEERSAESESKQFFTIDEMIPSGGVCGLASGTTVCGGVDEVSPRNESTYALKTPSSFRIDAVRHKTEQTDCAGIDGVDIASGDEIKLSNYSAQLLGVATSNEVVNLPETCARVDAECVATKGTRPPPLSSSEEMNLSDQSWSTVIDDSDDQSFTSEVNGRSVEGEPQVYDQKLDEFVNPIVKEILEEIRKTVKSEEESPMKELSATSLSPNVGSRDVDVKKMEEFVYPLVNDILDQVCETVSAASLCESSTPLQRGFLHKMYDSVGDESAEGDGKVAQKEKLVIEKLSSDGTLLESLDTNNAALVSLGLSTDVMSTELDELMEFVKIEEYLQVNGSKFENRELLSSNDPLDTDDPIDKRDIVSVEEGCCDCNKLYQLPIDERTIARDSLQMMREGFISNGSEEICIDRRADVDSTSNSVVSEDFIRIHPVRYVEGNGVSCSCHVEDFDAFPNNQFETESSSLTEQAASSPLTEQAASSPLTEQAASSPLTVDNPRSLASSRLRNNLEEPFTRSYSECIGGENRSLGELCAFTKEPQIPKFEFKFRIEMVGGDDDDDLPLIDKNDTSRYSLSEGSPAGGTGVIETGSGSGFECSGEGQLSTSVGTCKSCEICPPSSVPREGDWESLITSAEEEVLEYESGSSFVGLCGGVLSPKEHLIHKFTLPEVDYQDLLEAVNQFEADRSRRSDVSISNLEPITELNESVYEQESSKATNEDTVKETWLTPMEGDLNGGGDVKEEVNFHFIKGEEIEIISSEEMCVNACEVGVVSNDVNGCGDDSRSSSYRDESVNRNEILSNDGTANSLTYEQFAYNLPASSKDPSKNLNAVSDTKRELAGSDNALRLTPKAHTCTPPQPTVTELNKRTEDMTLDEIISTFKFPDSFEEDRSNFDAVFEPRSSLAAAAAEVSLGMSKVCPEEDSDYDEDAIKCYSMESISSVDSMKKLIFHGRIVHVGETPLSVWVQSEDDTYNIRKVETVLDEGRSCLTCPETVQVGRVYVSYHFGSILRAKVLSIEGKDAVKVRFVDVGKVYILKTKNLYKCPGEVVGQGPLARNFYLPVRINEECVETAVTEIQNRCLGRRCSYIFLTPFMRRGASCPYAVVSSDSTGSVSEFLINLGLADGFTLRDVTRLEPIEEFNKATESALIN